MPRSPGGKPLRKRAKPKRVIRFRVPPLQRRANMRVANLQKRLQGIGVPVPLQHEWKIPTLKAPVIKSPAHFVAFQNLLNALVEEVTVYRQAVTVFARKRAAEKNALQRLSGKPPTPQPHVRRFVGKPRTRAEWLSFLGDQYEKTPIPKTIQGPTLEDMNRMVKAYNAVRALIERINGL